jgi:SNF2 family DNA or RNA helicase
MTERVEVALPHADTVELRGGQAKGLDAVHRTVSGWPGWKRLPGWAKLQDGSACSLYRARLWPHTVAPLLRSTWTVQCHPSDREKLQACVAVLTEVERALGRQERVAIALFEGERLTSRVAMLHQWQAVKALEAHHHQALLNDDMGLGKTATALWSWWWTAGRRLVVVCPKSVKLNWRAEVAVTLAPPEALPCFVVDGTPTARADTFAALAHHLDQKKNQRAVLVINYDSLRLLPVPQRALLQAWCDEQAVILDESHYIKSHDAARTEAVFELFSEAKFRLALSGTPVRNTIEDLFTQCEFVRPGSWTSVHDFRNRYLVIVPTTFNGRKRPVNIVRGTKNVAELNAVLNTMRVARKKEDVLDLPPKIYTKPLIELEDAHLSVYKAMKEYAVVELAKLMLSGLPGCPKCEGKGSYEVDDPNDPLAPRDIVSCECTNRTTTIFQPAARSTVEAAMRCEQIAQGFLGGIPETYLSKHAAYLVKHAEKVDGMPGALVFPASPKLVWLCDAIEEITGADRQVVVFSRFNVPLLWLAKKYEELAVLLVGSVDTFDRQLLLDSFFRKEKRIMLCQVKLAEGFNLTSASDVLFLGRDWSPAINAQAEARCHRIGSKGTVNVQIPIVHNTIEKMIDKALSAKDANAEQALRNVTVQQLVEAL